MVTTRWHTGMEEIPRDEWNRLATLLPTPLLEWDWLYCLEASKSIAPRHGWVPTHLTCYRNGKLVAAVPLYIRNQSMGEFVFDFALVDVAEQIGIRYYPKLVGMSPATPSTAFRFLIDPEEDEEEISREILEAIFERAREVGCRAVQFNYVEPEFRSTLARAGFTEWRHQGFLWENDGFTDFDDYLAIFRKNQRRNIRRERASMGEQELEVRLYQGAEIPPSYFTRMAEYYHKTNDQFGPWAARFLNSRFFDLLEERFRDRIAMVAALDSDSGGEDDPLALSFLLVKNETILGRYWGTREYRDNLHFNVCYYEPINWAIRNGYNRFDPGMGSSHKIRRGFRAVANYSHHYFLDERMQAIFRGNIDRINRYEEENIRLLNENLPLKAPSGR
ncbi:MAG: GNAT family N-acetyltransferase [Alkalispirochaetaceae bacterium]